MSNTKTNNSSINPFLLPTYAEQAMIPLQGMAEKGFVLEVESSLLAKLRQQHMLNEKTSYFQYLFIDDKNECSFNQEQYYLIQNLFTKHSIMKESSSNLVNKSSSEAR